MYESLFANLQHLSGDGSDPVALAMDERPSAGVVCCWFGLPLIFSIVCLGMSRREAIASTASS